MPAYRLFPRLPSGTTLPSTDFACEDDAGAFHAAVALLQDGDVGEVWRGATLLGSVTRR